MVYRNEIIIRVLTTSKSIEDKMTGEHIQCGSNESKYLQYFIFEFAIAFKNIISFSQNV